MKIKVISSSSAGNCYLLYNDTECLIIECGVKAAFIKQALNFDLSKVVGVIITHEHQDHCKAVREIVTAGIKVYASPGTIDAFNLLHHRLNKIEVGKTFTLGGFRIKSFDVKHDCKEPVGYLIEHEETGRIVFITDSYYCPYTFPGLNNIIIEANYSQEILDRKVSEGVSQQFLRDRVLESHMSLATCKEFLNANDLTAVNNILLIHLSDNNSNANQFRQEVLDQTAKNVHIADKGLCINFNKTPF
jgi:phosphoribosyl 1,2-cyclic phosphodiesterase